MVSVSWTFVSRLTAFPKKKNTRSEEVSAFGKRRCRCNYKMGLEATSFCLVAIYKYLLGWVSGFSFSFYQSFHQSDKSKTKEDSTLDLLACFSYIFISGKNVVIAAVCLNNMTYGKRSHAQIDLFNLLSSFSNKAIQFELIKLLICVK